MWYDEITAGLDKDGELVAWRHTIVGQSIIAGSPFAQALIKERHRQNSVEGAADIPYDIPNILVDLHSPKLGCPFSGGVLWAIPTPLLLSRVLSTSLPMQPEKILTNFASGCSRNIPATSASLNSPLKSGLGQTLTGRTFPRDSRP